MANLEPRKNELKGTETEKNLLAAFAGESQARNKYTYFASKAKKDGYVQISKIFEETANNEKEHAKMWYKILTGIGSTVENLKEAAEGESYEWQEMYPSFAAKAREEGFNDPEVRPEGREPLPDKAGESTLLSRSGGEKGLRGGGAGKPQCSSRGRPGFRGTLWVASRVPSALSTSNS